MPINAVSARRNIKDFNFKELFLEDLNWDRFKAQPIKITVNNDTYTLAPVAEKRGFQVFECSPNADGDIPDRSARMKIERELARLAAEHLIIFVNRAREQQMWQWARREPGRPLAVRAETFERGGTGERLLQKLRPLFVSFEEEANLFVTDVAGRARQGFDVDRITKRFYDKFKAEHAAFLKFIKGIQSQGDQEWYASLMLNRLMFIYFIQKKGFLDGDDHYLRNRLRGMQETRGRDKFHSFYRYFLLRLFHEGLGQQQHSPELDKLLGRVPYLNGGLFDIHELERENSQIEIEDKAFERIFEFFDAYQWHLDDRPLRNDYEINPDVLGYIFEKYINQKQMGAYYTKEDITEYISKNTIIPFVFDAARKDCAIAFRADGAAWRLLRDNPDRYIYDAVKHGISVDAREKPPQPLSEPVALPPEIAAGLEDVSERGGWNRTASVECGLPTETWREVVARRKRYEEVRAKLAAGEVHEINDLITSNLDLRQFAQDVIDNCEGVELLRAIYAALERVTVLDPTCGSGAFLFAALNILEPMYESCLRRMQEFVEDLEASGEKHSPKKFDDFRQTLARIKQHNRRYYILKSIIIGNLYGVDIMEEATEICKLRLFLKLVAQLERPEDIEPLPDLDFNIRAGNTLVGFATYDEVQKAVSQKTVKGITQAGLGYDDPLMQEIDEKAEIAARAFEKFREMQTEHGMDAKEFHGAKKNLRERLDALDDELDRYLAGEYGIDAKKPKDVEKWRESHQPFHWFVEFYEIIKRGGFDVIIGNPPYVEMNKVRDYRIRDYETHECGNLYAPCVERSSALLTVQGRFGMIVPLSGFSTERMQPYQNLLWARYGQLHISYYSGDAHPSVIFNGVKYRLCIILGSSTKNKEGKVFVTNYLRWYADARETLFPTLSYIACPFEDGFLRFTKLDGLLANSIAQKMLAKSQSLNHYIKRRGTVNITYHRSPVFWIRSMDFEPYFKSPTRERSEDHLKDLYLDNKSQAQRVGAIINSTCFYFWFTSQGNCRNVTGDDIANFPVGDLNLSNLKPLESVFSKLMKDLQRNSRRRVYNYEHSGRVEYDEFYPNKSKPIIDEIDRALAKHYGFTDEELDFIINYDIKYRMGRDDEEE